VKIINNNIIINIDTGLFSNPPGKYTMPATTMIIKIINTKMLYMTNLSLLNTLISEEVLLLVLVLVLVLSDKLIENTKNKNPNTIIAMATENV
jgi:hypothetical protein